MFTCYHWFNLGWIGWFLCPNNALTTLEFKDIYYFYKKIKQKNHLLFPGKLWMFWKMLKDVGKERKHSWPGFRSYICGTKNVFFHKNLSYKKGNWCFKIEWFILKILGKFFWITPEANLNIKNLQGVLQFMGSFLYLIWLVSPLSFFYASTKFSVI